MENELFNYSPKTNIDSFIIENSLYLILVTNELFDVMDNSILGLDKALENTVIRDIKAYKGEYDHLEW
jgi:hypothetical protein